MGNWEHLFDSDDEEEFRTLANDLLALGAADKRGMSERDYISLVRNKWRSCETDSVYAIKLIFDPLVQPQFKEESNDEIFCVLVARVGHQGELIDAPKDYDPPEYPDVRLSHVVAGSPSGGYEPNPEKPATYLFAFLDVLGFESLLGRIGLEKVHSLYVELLEQALRPESEEKPWSKSNSIVQNQIVPALMWLPIHTTYFSDSLLLWVHFHPGHVGEFLSRCSRVFCKALDLGIPLRGAITVGNAVFNKEEGIYLGEPLVEAARLESKQNWIGIALGTSFKSESIRVPIPPEVVFQYLPPLKSGGKKLFSDLVLDWPRVWRKTYPQSSAVDKLNELSNKNLPEHLKQRYHEASKFYTESEKNKDWFMP